MVNGSLRDVQDTIEDILYQINEAALTARFEAAEYIKILIPNIYVTKLIGTGWLIRWI